MAGVPVPAAPALDAASKGNMRRRKKAPLSPVKGIIRPRFADSGNASPLGTFGAALATAGNP
jgi:hypothetical protein